MLPIECPKCGDHIAYQIYSATPGDVASAKCMTAELDDYGMLGKGLPVCTWTGKVVRLQQGCGPGGLSLAIACQHSSGLCREPAGVKMGDLVFCRSHS